MAEEPEAVASAYNESLLNVRGCQHGLETFHQATGQCWSDALSIFLLFANNLGPIVQAKLIAEGENIKVSFGEWATENREFIQEVAGFELDDPTFNKFVMVSQQFLYCLYLRLKNSKLAFHGFTTNKNINKRLVLAETRRRRASMCLSSCQAEFGAFANELLLMHKSLTIPNINLKGVLEIFPQNLHRAINSSEPIQPSGYKAQTLGKFVSIVTKYFLHTITAIELNDKTHETIAPIIKIQDCILYKNTDKPSLGFESPILLNFNALKNRDVTNSKFDNNSTQVESKIYVIQSYNFIVNIPEEQNYSCLATVIKDSSGHAIGHAISFLSCSDGKQFLYDDTFGFLINLDWRKVINKKYTHFFYSIKNNIPILWGYNANSDESNKYKFIRCGYNFIAESLTSLTYNYFESSLEEKGYDVYKLQHIDILYTQAPRAGGAGATGGYRRTRKSSKKVRRRVKASRRVRAP